MAQGDSVLHSALLPLTNITARSNAAVGPLVRPSPTATPVPSDDEALMEAAGLGPATAQPTPSPTPPIFITYVVQDGDTVSGIASRFGLSDTSVIWNNDLESADSLSLGQQLRLPASDGIIYDVKSGDTLSDIAAGFSVDVQAIIAFPANGLSDVNSLAVGQTIFVPGGSMPAPVATATPAPPESTPSPDETAAPPPAPLPVPAPGDNSSDLGARAVEMARSRIGSPYAPGGDGPNSFDCSGLVNWVYSQLGVDVPRSAADQYNWATPVSRDEMEPGDLVFFTGTSSSGGITHVGIYAGGGGVIMAVDNGDVVREVSLGEDYWNTHFAAAGRPR